MAYPNYPNSIFPDAVDDISEMSDLEVGDMPLIATYYDFMNTGNISGAQQFLETNPGLLPKLFNALAYNKQSDAIMATQQWAKDNQASLNLVQWYSIT